MSHLPQSPQTQQQSQQQQQQQTNTIPPHPPLSTTAPHALWPARYHSGDLSVWGEICAAGTLSAPQRLSARAVSDVMMDRVLHNVQLLHARLRARGWHALTGEMLDPHSHRGDQILLQLQSELGDEAAIPPSLCSFLTCVHSVDLTWNFNCMEAQAPPKLVPSAVHIERWDALDPLYVDIDEDVLHALFNERGERSEVAGEGGDEMEEGEEGEQEGEDCNYGEFEVDERGHYQSQDQSQDQRQRQRQRQRATDDGGLDIMFAPSAQQKINRDLQGRSYTLRLPCAEADPVLWVGDSAGHGEDVRLVQYLRDALRLGGFYGLRQVAITPDVRALLEELTEGFLQF